MLKSILLYFSILVPFLLQAQKESDNIVPNQLIVQFRDAENANYWLRNQERNASKVALNRILSTGLNIYLFDTEDIEAAKKQFESSPSVLFVQNNHILKERGPLNPNDSLFNLQGYLRLVKANEVWATTTGGKTACGDEIVVAVSEGNCLDYNHPDLINNIYINKKEVPDDNIDNDGNGYVDDYYGISLITYNGNITCSSNLHATKVCGIIGAKGNNTKGVSGVNWNVKMLFIRDSGKEDKVIESYEYIRSLRKKYNDSNGKEGAFVCVTNFSAGIEEQYANQHPIWCSMYDSLGKQGIVNISAASNYLIDVEKSGDIPSLCTSEYLLAVTNTDINDNLFASSGFKSIDLSAPGQQNFNILPNNLYGTSSSGTSFASPVVAGAAALLFSAPYDRFCTLIKENPIEAGRVVINAIKSGVDLVKDLKDVTVTGGRLNIQKSFEIITNKYADGLVFPPKINNIYPNPTLNLLYMTTDFFENETYTVYVYDEIGRLVYQESRLASKIEEELDFSELTTGIYFLKIANEKGNQITKFIKM
ncbi:MAG: S8 family peptidase [Saprospiraceae bacterium]|nr:S8 family peptidase [Saprospiraceae bacterium]